MTRITFAAVAPGWTELAPWTDKKGRFDTLRATVFAVLLVPLLWLAARWLGGMLGPEPVNAAIHSTGYAAIWLLIASLVVTPFKALSGMPSVAVLRRMIGNAALLYALLHLVLYMMDQKWRMATIVMEIARRFYLTIGFAALLGLVALGLTSTDGWAKALGRKWKRLHRIVYALTALGLVHYVLQSKLDVSQALVAAGIFGWLMLWRAVPAGPDRNWPTLLGISVAAALLTVAAEYAWYRFGTRIDPLKVVMAEADIAFGLHPAGQVLVAGLAASGLVLLWRVGDTPFGAKPAFTMLVFALGAFADDAVGLVLGWSLDDMAPEQESLAGMDLVWFVLLGTLGMARWKLRNDRSRHLVDVIWLICILHALVLMGMGNRTVGAAVAAVIIGFSILLGHRLWTVSRGAAITLVPLGLLLAYEAVSLF